MINRKGGQVMSELKQTPLYPIYKNWGAKTIDFGGWELPVQFSGIKKEHEAVRTKAGLFDVSHMGEILVSGPDSEEYLQKMLSNDLSKLKINKAQYTILCNEQGGTIDDLLIYKLTDTSFLLVVNAANTDKDFEWLKKHQSGEVTVENISSSYAQLALQGPLAQRILQKLVKNEDLDNIKFFSFKQDVQIGDVQALVSRSGYTGEDGFEIYCKQEDAIYIWENILTVGESEGVVPCGLGARDTLRFEAGLPLYGQELSENISPIEAGLQFAVKVNKEQEFIGKSALQEQITNGPKRKVVGIEMIERGIPRTGYKVLKDGQEIGYVTTGTQSPTLQKSIGMALIDSNFAEVGTELEVEIRNKSVKGKIIPTPFYKRK